MIITKWAKDIQDKYLSGVSNAFILYGNIGDYAERTNKVTNYLFTFLHDRLKITNIAMFDPVNGSKYIYKHSLNNDGESLKDVCNNLINKNSKIGYVISYPKELFPNNTQNLSENNRINLITLHKTLNSIDFINSDNIVILVTENLKDLNQMLLSSNTRTTIVKMTLPNEKERIDFINYKIKTDDNIKNLVGTNIRKFSNLTAGLSLTNIEDITLNAEYNNALDKNMILKRKEELIKKEYSDIIELYDTEGFSLNDFAGQDHIKQYFKDVVIDAIKNNETQIIPKGILLMGPPGTGKTYFARCLAGDAGISFVEFKMSKILDKWVGEAEKNLEKAFSVFRALAPVGVFIDEIDQALGRGENEGNSVSKNIFGMFLSELSKPENRGKIIWLGATNYPNRIDEALKRPGRFDKKIPFFAPSENERSEVFKIHLNKTKYPLSNDIDTDILASKTEGYTQAEIENIVVKALELTIRSHQQSLNQSILMKALEYMLSSQNSRIKEMENIAILECNDLEFLPKKYYNKRQELLLKQKIKE